MKEIEKEIKVTKTETIYVADDGKEFKNLYDCRDYEINKRYENIKKYELESLRSLVPLDYDGMSDESGFVWYKVNNLEEYNEIENAFSNMEWYHKHSPNSFPATFCIEDYNGWLTMHYLDEIINNTKRYFEKFGLKTTIE